MDTIQRTLIEAGFTDKEAIVYLTLLSCGSASAYTVAEKSGLKPSTSYLTLYNLTRKGLVSTIPRAKKKLFIAKDPREVISYLEERTARAKRALPEMLSLIPAHVPKLKIQYFQGMKGVQEALNYGITHKIPTTEIVGFYASGSRVERQYMDMSVQFMRSLKKRGVRVRGITPDDATIREIKKLNDTLGHELRTIPLSEYSAQASIEAEDKLVRIILNNDQRALIIEDAELASMIKQIFEMVWKK